MTPLTAWDPYPYPPNGSNPGALTGLAWTRGILDVGWCPRGPPNGSACPPSLLARVFGAIDDILYMNPLDGLPYDTTTLSTHVHTRFRISNSIEMGEQLIPSFHVHTVRVNHNDTLKTDATAHT